MLSFYRWKICGLERVKWFAKRNFETNDKLLVFTSVCLTSLVIREMQIKATVRYLYILIRISKMESSDNTLNSREDWRNWIPHPLLVEQGMVHTSWKRVWVFLKKLETYPAITLLAVHPREKRELCPSKICTQLFISSFICNSLTLETTKMLSP